MYDFDKGWKEQHTINLLLLSETTGQIIRKWTFTGKMTDVEKEAKEKMMASAYQGKAVLKITQNSELWVYIAQDNKPDLNWMTVSDTRFRMIADGIVWAHVLISFNNGALRPGKAFIEDGNKLRIHPIGEKDNMFFLSEAAHRILFLDDIPKPVQFDFGELYCDE